MRRLAALLAALALLLSASPAAARAATFTYSLYASADSLYAYLLCGDALTEDSYRTWYGNGVLNGAFTATVTFCADPGGEGLSVRASGKGVTGLTLTYPDGTVHAGLFQCVVSPEVFIGTIEPGTYTVTLTGTRPHESFLDIETGMASADWRAAHCP